MREVQFQYAKSEFKLLLTGKYTLVVGDSGSGKTLLSRCVRDYLKTPQLGKLYGCGSIDVLEDRGSVSTLESDTEVIVVDEMVLLQDVNGIVSSLRQYRHYYLIMCRDLPAKLPFGVHNVCTLKSDHNRYTMSQYDFSKELLRKAVNPDKYILCEDSKSGFYAAQAAYEQEPYVVESAGGKDNIIIKMPSSGYIVVDLCGLGNTTFKLVNYLNIAPSVEVCDVVSFEAEVLRMQGVDIGVVINGSLLLDNIEEYFEQLLSELLWNGGNGSYSKGSAQIARSLVTGRNEMSHTKLTSYRLVKDWWVPGVPHVKTNGGDSLGKLLVDNMSYLGVSVTTERAGEILSQLSITTEGEMKRRLPDILALFL